MGGSIREGVRLYKAKRYELALAELLQSDPEGPEASANAEFAYYLGLCYTKLERYEDALLYLEQVVTAGVDPLRASQCRFALAYVYSITGRSRLAEFELKRLVDSGYESPQIYSALAHASWLQRRVEPAVEYYRLALSFDAANCTALNGLGFVLSDSDKDVRRGLVYCKRAVDVKPQNPAYLDSLGWSHFKNGNLPEARTWLRRALDLAPRQDDIVSHMRVVIGEARS